jgi:hypothetical protein
MFDVVDVLDELNELSETLLSFLKVLKLNSKSKIEANDKTRTKTQPTMDGDECEPAKCSIDSDTLF